MVTVESAIMLHGHSNWDHYITGHELDDLVGRQFESVTDARKAATTMQKRKAVDRVRHTPIKAVLRLNTGSVIEVAW